MFVNSRGAGGNSSRHTADFMRRLRRVLDQNYPLHVVSVFVNIGEMKNVIVLPTFNEKENVTRIIPEIFKSVPEIFVLVVDDNSPDGTAKIVEGLKEKYPHLSLLLRKNKEGLGKAYIHGFSETLKEKGVEHIIMMDADLTHDPVHLQSMIEESKKYDLVIGSRYVGGGGTIGWKLWRRVLSRGSNFYCRLITGMPISDCTTAFNVINARLLRNIDLSNVASGFAFIIELKYLLWKAGASIKEIPMIFKNRIDGESKLSGRMFREGVLAPWKMIFKKIKRQSPACLACSASQTLFLTNKHSFDLYHCLHCDSVFVWPLPENYSDLYSEDYFSGATKGYGYVSYDQDKAVMGKVFGRYLDKIDGLLPQKGKLLDVGAATGYFLDLAKRRGWQTTGVEISKHASHVARGKGLDVKTGTLADIGGALSFDVITFWDVVEHLPRPEEALQMAHRLLKPGGVIAINTPDAGSLTSKTLGKRWHILVPPEHLIVFSGKQLINLLEKNGFKVKLATRIGKSFTLQYIFQILRNGSKFFLWHWLAKLTHKNFIGKISLPLNLRDNIFILATKS